MSAPWTGDDPAWPVRDAVVAWETPYFAAGYDVVERPDGERATYYWVEPADAVIVVALTDDREVVVVEQYRPRFRMHTIGLPAGGIDGGGAVSDGDDPSGCPGRRAGGGTAGEPPTTAEDPAAAAARELREETGYVADELTRIETYAPSGWVRYVRHVFVAEGLSPGEPDPDEGEFIEVDAVPAPSVLDAVRSRDGPANGGALTPLLLAREEGLL